MRVRSQAGGGEVEQCTPSDWLKVENKLYMGSKTEFRPCFVFVFEQRGRRSVSTWFPLLSFVRTVA